MPLTCILSFSSTDVPRTVTTLGEDLFLSCSQLRVVIIYKDTVNIAGKEMFGDNKIITIPYKDDLWHTLSFAYNSVTHDTTFYIDGEFYAALNFPTAGLWVVSSSGIPAGKVIEFDDLKVYHLTTATSGITHTGDNGIVYDSYDYIVNEKLDNSGKYEINTSNTVISADAIKVEVAMGTTVEALTADVKSDTSVSYASVINAGTGAEADGAELASGKTLAVSKVNKNGSEICHVC